ncbi:uroporphyrinogen-III synthase [Litchfieldia salsa]|uniref:Uroporphyrinogen-III synthase n=1 Tax=Litchfieldia salsa TaxID=930152 RepID=A0A1H0RVU6_9BACI|nr:uroporphyrinogen-III synthase [Litchfieldia salsa]SDP33479.1 uroporphyrinogen-III synthase [Litchfieldia salsa]
MKKLEGKRIALVGPRKAEEMSIIVQNLGGIPLVRPAQGTVFLDDSNVENEIKRLINGDFDWIILTTGVGTERLYNTSINLGLGDQFIAILQRMNIAARGYKTVNFLKKLGLSPLVRDDDGSTAGLVRSLATHSLSSKNVALQLHGDPAPLLIEFLENQNATYEELLPYQHTPPEEHVLELLVEELLKGEIDAVAFTSTPQVRFLMSYAQEKGVREKLLEVFSTQVIALAVGKVTAQALREVGIERVVFPENERMGSMIVELADYYKKN